MKTELLFLDTVCPTPYDCASLNKGRLGGTEATVIRVAENIPMLATVAQHNKALVTLSPNHVTYRSLQHKDFKDEWRGIVVLRDVKAAIALRKTFERHTGQFFIWMHDAIEPSFAKWAPALIELDIQIICVSEWQKVRLLHVLKEGTNLTKYPKIHVIYNPVAPMLAPDMTHIDEHKLVFFSSPHKGLLETLEIFQALVELQPKFRLYVANPGYFNQMDLSKYKNVVELGELGHAEVLQHVRSALCVFYPNYVFPETFGLVMAEANAVGTPVITHELGAAREVLTKPEEQIVDCMDKNKVMEKVVSWSEGARPLVVGKDEFRISNVVSKWRQVVC